MTQHVHFTAQLAAPPADRPRLGVRYPRVAQKKGSPDRAIYDDLNWSKHHARKTDAECDDHVCLPSTTMEAQDGGEVRHGMNKTNRNSLGNLLAAACEALVPTTMSQHPKPSKIPARTSMNLLLPCDERWRGPSLSPQSSTCGTTSSRSSSSTASSLEADANVRPWS